jgi:hypothetical protein
VVSEVPDDALLFAEVVEGMIDNTRGKQIRFSFLSDTWRSKDIENPSIVAKGKLLSYLNSRAIALIEDDEFDLMPPNSSYRVLRVRERDDLKQLMLPMENL